MTIVYYQVREPGVPDIFHESEKCAGNYTKEVEKEEAIEANATPCGNCAV